MKKRVLIFIVFAILCIGLMPVYNFFKWDGEKKEFFKKDHFFSMDNIAPYPSRMLYELGISMDPEQVIIGQDKWLFLGDQYAKTITSKREGLTKKDTKDAQRAAATMEQWFQFAQDHGVKDFRILIGPDKASVYPEFVPAWAKPAAVVRVDAVAQADATNRLINPRDYLINRKQDFGTELYYQTDTHWNSIGAWLSFEFFLHSITGIELPVSSAPPTVTMETRQGGDLARFLRIRTHLKDREPRVKVPYLSKVNTKQYDFASGELLREGGNPSVAAPMKAIKVVSDKALTAHKVIWLRDSFGTAMSPYMAQVFSESVQLHYSRASTEWLADAIKEYQPDYVLVTAVERNVPSSFFVQAPPAKSGSTLDR